MNFQRHARSCGAAGALADQTSAQHIIVISTHLYWDSEKVADQMKELREVEEALLQMRKEVAEKFERRTCL